MTAVAGGDSPASDWLNSSDPSDTPDLTESSMSFAFHSAFIYLVYHSAHPSVSFSDLDLMTADPETPRPDPLSTRLDPMSPTKFSSQLAAAVSPKLCGLLLRVILVLYVYIPYVWSTFLLFGKIIFLPYGEIVNIIIPLHGETITATPFTFLLVGEKPSVPSLPSFGFCKERARSPVVENLHK